MFCSSGGNSSPPGHKDGSGEAGVAGGDGGGPVGGDGGHMAVLDGAVVGGRVGGRLVPGGAAVGDDAVKVWVVLNYNGGQSEGEFEAVCATRERAVRFAEDMMTEFSEPQELELEWEGDDVTAWEGSSAWYVQISEVEVLT